MHPPPGRVWRSRPPTGGQIHCREFECLRQCSLTASMIPGARWVIQISPNTLADQSDDTGRNHASSATTPVCNERFQGATFSNVGNVAVYRPCASTTRQVFTRPGQAKGAG